MDRRIKSNFKSSQSRKKGYGQLPENGCSSLTRLETNLYWKVRVYQRAKGPGHERGFTLTLMRLHIEFPLVLNESQ